MKKFLLLSLSIIMLANCSSSPKYKISDQILAKSIEINNDIEQCINPNLTNEASYSLLSQDEKNLLIQYEDEVRRNLLGEYNYNIMMNDPESYSYYRKRHSELNHNMKGNTLTAEQCKGFQMKFHNDLANINAKRFAQEQEKLRQEEERIRQIQNAPKPKRQTTINCVSGKILFNQQNCVISEY